MSFIRTKKIKKKSGNCYEYAYLVENKWRKRLKGSKKGARQKVKAFLGRVYSLNLVNDRNFSEHYNIKDIDEYVKENSLSKITKDLVLWEFFKHDVKDVAVDFEEIILRKDKNKIVLRMNEGFLCDCTLKKLLNFKFKEDEYDAGVVLAKVFVEAGIKIPRELFVKVFEKINS